MRVSPITSDISVASQIVPDDIPAIANAGIKTLVCNRPDGEEFSQPAYETIKSHAEAVGIEVHYVPISHRTGITPEVVSATKVLLESAPRPILAYCRSGSRSAFALQAAFGGVLPR